MTIPDPKRKFIAPDTYAIIVALGAGAQTGREVQSRVRSDSLGLYIRDSVIYFTLHRLCSMGLVQRDNNGFFELTDEGRHWLRVETRTYKRLVEQATRRVRD